MSRTTRALALSLVLSLALAANLPGRSQTIIGVTFGTVAAETGARASR